MMFYLKLKQFLICVFGLSFLIVADVNAASYKSIKPADAVKEYRKLCDDIINETTNDPTSSCVSAAANLMVLQFGTSDKFDKLGGLEGVKGAYNIFKKTETVFEKLNSIQNVLNKYWEYQMDDNLTSDQKALLVFMNVADEFLSERMSPISLGGLADSLKGILKKQNEYNNILTSSDATAQDVILYVKGNCWVVSNKSCLKNLKSVELYPIYTFKAEGGGYSDTLWYNLPREYTTRENINSLRIIPNDRDYFAPFKGKQYGFNNGIKYGVYVVIVTLTDGSIQRDTLMINKSDESYYIKIRV